MTIFDAIAQRRSCRTFNGLKLDSEVNRKIVACTKELLPLFSSVRMPRIELIEDSGVTGRLGTYGAIAGARQFLALICGASVQEAVQAGFAFEQVVLRCQQLGLATCWLGGTFRKSRFADAVGLKDEEVLPIVSPVGHSTLKTRFAERVMRSVVHSDKRKPFNELFDPRGWPESEKAMALHKVLESVRLAPSSSNSQPWRASIEFDSDGMPVKVNFRAYSKSRFTPFDMGIAYCHFLLASTEMGLSWKLRDEDAVSPLSLCFRMGV